MSKTLTRVSTTGIKAAAKGAGLRVDDLLALSPSNDPYYRTPAKERDAIWFASLWRKGGFDRAHLRRVHYWAVSKQIPLPLTLSTGKGRNRIEFDIYRNYHRAWSFLCSAAKHARNYGLVDVADIIDAKHPDPHLLNQSRPLQDRGNYEASAWQTPLDRPFIDLKGWEQHDHQPYSLVVFVEKSTMNDVLQPVCQRYGADLYTFTGEVSLSACFDLMLRSAALDKPTRVFYISDYDPAGNNMPVSMSRKLEAEIDRAVNSGLIDYTPDIRVTPLALTVDQVNEYSLPRVPLKDSEVRADNWEAIHGEGAVELDALEADHPGELARLLSEAFEPYYDRDVARRARQSQAEARRQVQEAIDEITGKKEYAEALELIRKMQQEIEDIEIDTDELVVEASDLEADEDDPDWLFISEAGYVDQIARYKRHRGGDGPGEYGWLRGDDDE